MTLRIPVKVLLHVWSYDFYDMMLSTGKQRRHMISTIMSHIMRKPTWFPNRSTPRRWQEMGNFGLIKKVEEFYCPYSENKGEADLHLRFCIICKMLVFS